MDLDLTPEQSAFRDEVRAFIRERLPADMRERMRKGYPPTKAETVAWQRILNERGWAAPHWPQQYGGAELGQMERLILLDEIYRAPAPIPLVFNINMLGPVLLKFGTEAQRQHFLPKLASLDLWFCQGFSEPGAGSDLASLKTRAVRQGDQYIVNGQKIWTSTAHHADWIFALVRTDNEGRKQDGISFLLIDLKSPGVTVRPIISIDGGHHLNEVFFEDVRVPIDNRVGDEHRGWQCAKYLLASERTGIASIGYCRERLDYAKQLIDTAPEGTHDAQERHRLLSEIVLLDAEVRALEVTNWRYLLTPNEQQRMPAFASVLKLRGTVLQQDITALLASIDGLAALERPTDSEGPENGPLLSRHLYLRAATIYGGSSEVQKDILAKTILG